MSQMYQILHIPSGDILRYAKSLGFIPFDFDSQQQAEDFILTSIRFENEHLIKLPFIHYPDDASDKSEFAVIEAIEQNNSWRYDVPDMQTLTEYTHQLYMIRNLDRN